MPAMKLLWSEARNKAAEATSSGRANRARGVIAVIWCMASAAPSLDGNCPQNIGVSTAPGVNTLVLIFCSLRLLVHVRAKDGLVKTVEIVALADIGLYADDVQADLRDGLVDLGLPPPGDKNVGTLFNEPFCGREANATASSGDHGDLVFQQRHYCFRRLVRRAACTAFRVATNPRRPAVRGRSCRSRRTRGRERLSRLLRAFRSASSDWRRASARSDSRPLLCRETLCR